MYYVARTLVMDVIDAAAGVERAHIKRVTNGHVWLRFPDSATGPIYSAIELTYNANRDGATVANSLMSAVERFIDELLMASPQLRGAELLAQ